MTCEIYCCKCGTDVFAELTTGAEVYPHRPDLHSLPFWICRSCDNFVGCHHKTKDRTMPMGVIADQLVKDARKRIHTKIDPLWKSRRIKRSHIYAYLSGRLGCTYHTGEIRSVTDAALVCKYLYELEALLNKEQTK